MALMVLRDIRKRYGTQDVLDGVSLEIEEGQVHALLGENGAGKSTLARILAGIAKPDDGVIILQQKDIVFSGPLDAQRHGVAIIHQELDLFAHLSIAENLVIGNLAFPEKRMARIDAATDFARPLLERVGLDVNPRQLVASLSIGQQQLVAIARALSMNCRILIMDEPNSALADDDTARLFGVMRRLRADGVAIVYISHKMEEIFAECDVATVLRDGAAIATREVAKVSRHELIAMMVGRSIAAVPRPRRAMDGPVRLDIRDIVTAKLRSISLQVRGGEVLGIAGLVGAGRSELGQALVGLDRLISGEMLIDGTPYWPRGPATARRRGMVLLPEDRKLQGLMPSLGVRENASLSILRRLATLGIIDRAAERSAFALVADQLSLKCASPDIAVGSLSGGNQQKALLARALLAGPEIIFLDDPTRGVDVGAKEDIYAVIETLAEAGKAVLLVSSELPELLRCADRIIVFADGRLTGEFAGEAATQEAIMTAATNVDASEAA